MKKRTGQKLGLCFMKLIRAFSIILFLFLAFLIFSGIYFLINRDKIAEKLLIGLNERSSGEVVFKNIALNPFKQFPSVSIALTGFEFYEKRVNINDSTKKPIGRFKNVYAAVDIIDLFRKEISVSSFILEDGELNIVKYPNKSFNFLNAIKIKKKEPAKKISSTKKSPQQKMVQKKGVKPKKGTVEKKNISNKNLILYLDKISFLNIKVNFKDRRKKKGYAVFVPKLNASFSIMPDSVQVVLNTDIKIRQLELSKKINFNNQDIHLETELSIDRNDSIIKLEPSKLLISKAEFKLDGMLDLRGEGEIDLSIDGADKDVSFFSLALTKRALDNIKKGDLYFKSTIKGNLIDEIPNIECDFGLRDFSMQIPNSEENIKDLNIHGYFKSGNKLDLSNASLEIDTLKAKLPGGYISGIIKINGFVEPYIDYRLDMRLAIDGLGRVFKLGVLDSLEGTIRLSDKFDGHFKADSGWVVYEKDELNLNFDSVSFRIPDVLYISCLDGQLLNREDKLNFNNIQIQTEKTDILINGNIINASNFIIDQKKEIIAELEIESKVLDLAGILSYYPSFGENFPYLIKGIELDVLVSTKAQHFKKFKRTPNIHFNIRQLDATIDSLLTPLSVKNGCFILSELDSTLFLDFQEFDIRIANGDLKAGFNYYFPAKDADSLLASIRAKNINMAKVFFSNPKDSIPEILNALLTGNFNFNLVMPKKKTEKFNKIELNTKTLAYINTTDTVNVDSLRFLATNIFYDLKRSTNPLASLSCSIDIFVGKFSSNYFDIQGVLYKTEVEDGTYTIIPKNDKWFGTPSMGKFVLAPFKKVPSYKMDYSVKQFQTNKLLTNLIEDTVLNGKMDFSFKLSFKGNNQKQIFESMNGAIRAKANGLVLYGLDIDDFIKNHQRSQHFNLLDIGAVVIAGPIGLAATKGTDYARIVISDYKKSTNITNMVSVWDIDNGKIILSDVAFTTNQNRLAMKGWYNLNTDSLDIQFAVLNDKGCSILDQGLSGPIKEPKLGKVRVIESLLAPITNLVDKTFSVKCPPFYKGSVAHPLKKENK